MVKKAVVIFSGGQDSTTVLAYAKNLGFLVHAISFNYGQRHENEIEAAKKIAELYDVTHHIINLDLSAFTNTALINQELEVPNYQGNEEIPITYVPARNTIFLSYALGYAETILAQDIFLGISQIDYSGYPDCRPEYLDAFTTLANLATKEQVNGKKMRIHAPLLHLSKKETVLLGQQLGVDYGMTVTCYKLSSEGLACGECESCVLRHKGFLQAGVNDPTRYIKNFVHND